MPNAEQSAHWNQAAGPRWATLADRTDKLFAAITAAPMKSTEAQAGENVLDVLRDYESAGQVDLGAGLWLASARA